MLLSDDLNILVTDKGLPLGGGLEKSWKLTKVFLWGDASSILFKQSKGKGLLQVIEVC